MDLALVVVACLAVAAVVGRLGHEPVRRAALDNRERPRRRQSRRAALAGGMMAALIPALLLVAVDTSGPGAAMPVLGILAQMVPVGACLVLSGCLAMLAWQPAWVAGELRRLAVGLGAASALAFAIGEASGSWLVVMLLAVAAVASLAHLLGTGADGPARDMARPKGFGPLAF